MPHTVLHAIVVRAEVQLAVPTFVRFLQRVQPHVTLQQLTASVRLVATFIRTTVRLFPCMRSYVLDQRRLSLVSLTAAFVATFVRFFARVRSPMNVQVSFGVAFLFTELTSEPGITCWYTCMPISHVQSHGRSCLETNSTMFTDELFAAVILRPVASQRWFEPKPFVTVCAFELAFYLVQLFLAPFLIKHLSVWLLRQAIYVILQLMIGQILLAVVHPVTRHTLNACPAYDRKRNTILPDSVAMLILMCLVFLPSQKPRRT